MFTHSKASKSVVDAVTKVLEESEFQPKKAKLILEPEKDTPMKKESAESESEYIERLKKSSPFMKGVHARVAARQAKRYQHYADTSREGSLDKKAYSDAAKGHAARHAELSKEETHHLSSVETAEKERIAKGMKKNLAEFKSRYGARAKPVMYATATKLAKNEEVEQIDELSSKNLKGKQYKLDKNHNGKLDSDDFKILRLQKNEEVEQLDELGGISTLADESKNVETTTDTLVGRKKGGGVNQHGPDRKIKLNAESKRPGDEVPFVTNEEGRKSPFNLAKNLAKRAYRRIQDETMIGKAGTTSEDKE